MRGCFGMLIYIFVTFWVILGTIVAVSAVDWALNRDFYTDVFADDAFLDAIYTDTLPRVIVEESLLREFSPEDPANAALSLALREVMPQEYLKGQIGSFIDSFFQYIEGTTDSFAFQMDLTPIKTNLLGQQGEVFASALVGQLPVCRTISQQVFPQGDLPACIPANADVNEFTRSVVASLPDLVAEMPDVIDASEESASRPENWPKFSVDEIRTVLTGSVVLIAALIWFVNGLIGSGRLRTLFSWLGISLFIPAGLVFIVGAFMVSSNMENNLRSSFAIDGGTGAFENELVDDAFEDSLLGALKRIGESLRTTATPPLAVAVILFIVSFLPFMKRQRDGDSHLDLPPSGKVKNRLGSNHDSPIKGI